MFALEDCPFVSFSPFFAVFPDGSISLNSARPRPAALQLLPNPFLGLRVRSARRPDHAQHPSHFVATGSQRAAVASRESTSGAKIHTMSTYTIATSKPLRMCTYRKVAQGASAANVILAANVYHLPRKGYQKDALFAGNKVELSRGSKVRGAK